MRLQIISESLDIFHRDQFLDPLRPSFKFDRHARETVGWRRRDPPKESFLVDDERDGFACRQRCASISLYFLVCHHGSPLPCGPLYEGLHPIQDGAPSTSRRPCPGGANHPGTPPGPECCRPRRWLGTFTSGMSRMQGPPDAYTLDKAPGRPHVCASLSCPCEPVDERLGVLLPGRRSLPSQAGRETAPWQGPSGTLPGAPCV